MNKKLILLSFLLILTFSFISFVSADLCRGSDGYYHDCSYSYGYGDYDKYDDYRDYDRDKLSYKDYNKDNYYKETVEYKKVIEKRERENYRDVDYLDDRRDRDYREDYYKDDRNYWDDRDYRRDRGSGLDDLWDTSHRSKDQYVIKASKPKSYVKTVSKPSSKSSFRYKEPYRTSDYKNCYCVKSECKKRRCVSFVSNSISNHRRQCYSSKCVESVCKEYKCEDKQKDDYYYKPRYDYESETFNWRW